MTSEAKEGVPTQHGRPYRSCRSRAAVRSSQGVCESQSVMHVQKGLTPLEPSSATFWAQRKIQCTRSADCSASCETSTSTCSGSLLVSPGSVKSDLKSPITNFVYLNPFSLRSRRGMRQVQPFFSSFFSFSRSVLQAYADLDTVATCPGVKLKSLSMFAYQLTRSRLGLSSLRKQT
jgi:hypothetical protein